MTSESPVTTSNSAAVVEQSLLAFGVGMTVENRHDIKNSYHYASLVASKQFSEEGQTELWLNKFLEVMQGFGWTQMRRSTERESSSSQSLTLGAVVFKGLKVVGQAVLSNPVTDALTELAVDALEGLGSITEAQDVFKRNLKERATSTVGLAACVENEAGEVLMVMSAVDAKPFSDHELDTVVFEWESKATALYSSNAVLIFNRSFYDLARNEVAVKLGERTIRNVLDYDI